MRFSRLTAECSALSPSLSPTAALGLNAHNERKRTGIWGLKIKGVYSFVSTGKLQAGEARSESLRNLALLVLLLLPYVHLLTLQLRNLQLRNKNKSWQDGA